MKNRFFLFAFVLLFSGSMFSMSINDDINDKGIGEGGPGIKPPTSAMALMANMNNIETTFFRDLGDVNIIVKDAHGLIYYKENVNTSQKKKLRISRSVLPAGKYNIEYTDSNNNLINKGNFEIK